MTVQLGRVGVWTSARNYQGAEPGQIAEFAAEVEQLGYGTLWAGLVPADLAPAETVLGATRDLAFATGITNVWTVPADEAVHSYHRLEEAFPNRLLLGVGAGHREAVQEYQRPYDKVNEYLDALVGQPDPVPAERLALAALGPKMLALAAERTRGAHPYLVPPEHTRQAREIIGPDTLLAPEHKVVLATDPDEARGIARQTVRFYLGLRNYVANLRRLGFTDEDLTGDGSDRLVDALVAWGDVDTVAAKIAEHHAAGADHVCIQVLTAEPGLPTEQLRALAPALV